MDEWSAEEKMVVEFKNKRGVPHVHQEYPVEMSR